ncbi:30S ribosomal protein S19 [Candidatus Woesearchaeota archaeon]|nr:30S ribosomal protein S19 [Candidatus Woesearchaeota archaeon]
MAKKDFSYRGKTIEELQAMNTSEFVKLLPSRQRRSLTRGFSEMQKRLLLKIKKTKEGKYKKPIKTHCRDMLIIPEMLGVNIHVHSGKAYLQIEIIPEMLGRYLGEMVLTRTRVAHSAPGIGATKSSSAASVK